MAKFNVCVMKIQSIHVDVEAEDEYEAEELAMDEAFSTLDWDSPEYEVSSVWEIEEDTDDDEE
jgi:hypothetical protein